MTLHTVDQAPKPRSLSGVIKLIEERHLYGTGESEHGAYYDLEELLETRILPSLKKLQSNGQNKGIH